MEIKSENKTKIKSFKDLLFRFFKTIGLIVRDIFNFINEKLWVIFTILFIVIGYKGYGLLDNTFYHIGIPLAVGLIFLLISSGEILETPSGYTLSLVIIEILVVIIIWLSSPIATKTDIMDIRSYITDIRSDGSSSIIIDLKTPFENEIDIHFNDKRWTKAIIDKEMQKEFNFNAEKKCEKTRAKKIRCTTSLIITHNYYEKNLVEKELLESIYPKKIDIE